MPSDEDEKGGPKVKECNDVVGVLNKGIEKLGTARHEQKDASSEEQLRALADVMDAVARDIETVPVTLPELVRKVADYRDMARETAKAARDLARATEAKSTGGIKAAEAALDRAVRREEPLVDDINAYCRSDP